MAKKRKVIGHLVFSHMRTLLYAMLYFICPNTASGSNTRLPLCLDSFLLRLTFPVPGLVNWFTGWLTSIIRFPRAFKTNFLQSEHLRIFVLCTGHFRDVIRSLFCQFWFPMSVHVLPPSGQNRK